jgi:hypothetical protein
MVMTTADLGMEIAGPKASDWVIAESILQEATITYQKELTNVIIGNHLS